jgi:hypothetical protein
MQSYTNPNTPIIDDPVNIDIPIQELQVQLAGLSWLDKSFGRAYESKKTVNGKPHFYPEVWQGLGLDLLNVLPNDNLVAQSFFKVEEPIETLEYQQDGYSMMRARVSLIVWFDLQRIYPALDYNYIELLKGQVQRLITTATLSSSNIEIVRVWDTAREVFKGYTLTEIQDQELVYPKGGFRFECLLTYPENCPDSVYGPPPVPPPPSFSQNQFLKLGDTTDGLSDDLKIVKDTGNESSPLKLSKTKVGIGTVNDVEAQLLKVVPHSLRYHIKANAASGRVRIATITASQISAAAVIVADSLRVYPWILCEEITVDRLSINVGNPGSVGAKIVMGLYSDNGSIYPGNMLISGEVVTDPTGPGTRHVILAAHVTLQPGLYWIASIGNSFVAPGTFRSIAPTQLAPVLGFVEGINNNGGNGTGYSVAHPYANVLPAVFPVGGSILLNTSFPVIGFREV